MVESFAAISVAASLTVSLRLLSLQLDPTIRFCRQGHGGFGLGILTADLRVCCCASGAGTSLCVCEAGLRSRCLEGCQTIEVDDLEAVVLIHAGQRHLLRGVTAVRLIAAVVGLSAGAVAHLPSRSR